MISRVQNAMLALLKLKRGENSKHKLLKSSDIVLHILKSKQIKQTNEAYKVPGSFHFSQVWGKEGSAWGVRKCLVLLKRKIELGGISEKSVPIQGEGREHVWYMFHGKVLPGQGAHKPEGQDPNTMNSKSQLPMQKAQDS